MFFINPFKQWRAVTGIVRQVESATGKLEATQLGRSGGMIPQTMFKLESPKSAFPAISGLNFPKKLSHEQGLFIYF